MHPIPKIVDQGYSKQTILHSQAYKPSHKIFFKSVKNFFKGFYRRMTWLTSNRKIQQAKTQSSNFDLNLVSSFEGEISKILFAFPYRYFNDEGNSYNDKVRKEMKDIFSKVIKKINTELAILYIITEKKAVPLIDAWLREEKIKNETNKDNFHFIITTADDFTIWIQDPIVVGKLKESANHFIKTPYDFGRPNDEKVAALTINSGSSIYHKNFLPIATQPLHEPLYFEGGNILIGDDFWLMGINDIAQGTKNLGVSPTKKSHINSIKKLYQQSLDARELIIVEGSYPIEVPPQETKEYHIKGYSDDWKEYFYRGNDYYPYNYQPLFHIDMFISLAGRFLANQPKSQGSKFTLLVGSPQAAFDILTNCYPGIGNEDLLKVLADKLSKHKMYLAIKNAFLSILAKNKSMKTVIVDTGNLLVSFNVLPLIIDKITVELQRYETMQDNINAIYNNPEKRCYAQIKAFDNVASSFDTKKFNVIRNPLPFIYEDNVSEELRYWYFATGNNVVVQNGKEKKQVFLPTYGYGDWEILKWTDKANVEIWSNLGYEVVQLPNFQVFATNLGAMHCMIKTLERK